MYRFIQGRARKVFLYKIRVNLYARNTLQEASANSIKKMHFELASRSKIVSHYLIKCFLSSLSIGRYIYYQEVKKGDYHVSLKLSKKRNHIKKVCFSSIINYVTNIIFRISSLLV